MSHPRDRGLPGPLAERVADDLRELGDPGPVLEVLPVGGGCINNAVRVGTRSNRYLLKWNADPLPGMFECEARGLRLIRSTGAVRVPEVLSTSEAGSGYPAYILLEYLEGLPGSSMAALGEQVAEMHRVGVSPAGTQEYGLDHDNYLGPTLQVNAWMKDWTQFYLEYRIRPQVEVARRKRRLPPERERGLDRLVARLPELLSGVDRRPCLVHGDLWSGNIIPGPSGLALIDPAVSYSDREVEIAYTQLFGGFNEAFYRAYRSVWPLDPGYPNRRDLYNIYHLLNHLNIFGEQYGQAVDTVLKRYA